VCGVEHGNPCFFSVDSENCDPDILADLDGFSYSPGDLVHDSLSLRTVIGIKRLTWDG